VVASTGARAPGRDDLLGSALIFAAAFAFQAAVSIAAAASGGLPLHALAAYYDGHLYLEIAKSFPLPYSPAGPDYLGHAPGYPALIALIHALSPDAWVDWGMAALLGAWIPAAASALAFRALCRAHGVAPLWPVLLFAAANPFRVLLGSTAHAEPCAELLAILCFVAFARGRLGWSALWLALASLCRFPAILLGIPLAFGVWFLRRERSARTLALLGAPLLAPALLHLYLWLRIPGFRSIFASHAIFWRAPFEDPFSSITALARMGGSWRDAFPLWAVWLSLLVYALAIAVGLRRSERDRSHLAVWAAVIVVFHAALSGVMGALAIPRMMILAWPPSVLILWRPVGPRLPRAAAALLCAALAVGSFVQSRDIVAWVTHNQKQTFLPDVIARMDDDRPHWIDFEAWRAERKRELRETRPGRPGAPSRPGPDPGPSPSAGGDAPARRRSGPAA
jgi:hypothetical protein